MPSLDLYREYRRDEALALLGEGEAEFVEDHHGFFVAGEVALCLVTLSRGRARPCFPDRSSFFWPSDCSPEILQRRLPVQLFIQRRPEVFVYVGAARVVSYGSGRQTEWETCFAVPTLTRKLFLEFSEITRGQIMPEPPAEAEVLRLGPKSSTEQRMHALKSFLSAWYGPSSPALVEAVPDVPGCLLEFHRCIAGLPKVTSFNELLPLKELVVKRGRILFYVENQGVCLWSTKPLGDDPPVWWRLNETGKKWLLEDEPLSGFLIQLVLLEALWGAPFGASAANIETAAVEQICQRMTPLPLGTWRWPYDERGRRSRFYARDGALMFCTPNEDYHSVYVGAKDPHSLTFLDELIDDGWEHVAF